MKLRIDLIVLMLLAFAAPLYGETWTSEDGTVSVEVPDQERFVEVDTTEPMSVLWILQDESLKLGVVEVPWPLPGKKVKAASIHEGLAEEIDGKIVDASERTVDGYTVHQMTGEGNALGPGNYISQEVVQVGNKIVKLMVIGLGKDPRTDKDSQKFLSSLKIHKQAVTETRLEPLSNGAMDPDERSRVNKLSGRVGAISVLILVVIAIVTFSRRSSRKETDSN